MQKQYGKTQSELQTLVEGFSWALADYHMPEIVTAMREYVKNHSDIPAPADIIKLINAAREPKAKEFTVEQLIDFKKKGIPLTPEQKDKISGLNHVA